jgi:pyridoxamine-phosphate oxidase
MKSVAEIRREYSLASLDLADVNPSPIKQFEHWFEEAQNAQVPEPNAMTLSTVTEDGRPSGRIVLLKGIENNKFLFFTNYQSQKGRELEKNPLCALTFFWPDLERQVRIEGAVARMSVEASEQYFQSRPRGSQVGAWASPQSSVINDRKILEQRVIEIEKKFEGKTVLPKPHQWGGYEVDPFEIEFWQGRESRLHDRIVYTKSESKWSINRLAP